MALLAAQHEFGACHGGIGDGFDALRLAVEFNSRGMRRFSGGACGRAEACGLRFQRGAGGAQRRLRAFDR